MKTSMFIRVCAFLGIGAMGLFASNAAMGAPKYQAELTVSGYVAESEALTDFPVLVRISADKISGFAYSQCAAADGSDISFVDANGTVLSHEVDTWNTAGESTVWVRIPSMTNGTTFRMRWGDSSPASVSAAKTWNANYVGVWHMGEESGVCANSTSLGMALDAVPKGDTVNSVRYTGSDAPIGYARTTATSAARGYLSIPSYNGMIDGGNVGDTFTMSGWARFDAIKSSEYPRLFSRKTAYNSEGWEIEISNNSWTRFTARGATQAGAGGDLPTLQNAWVHVVLVYSGASLSVYGNGAAIFSNSTTIKAATDYDKPLSIGCDSDGDGSYAIGQFDECRLMKGAASADWVKAEYDAVMNAEFVTAGAAEVLPVATPKTTSAGWQSIDVEFAADEAARNLIVVWGDEDKGTTLAAWGENKATIAVGANDTKASYSSFPEGWGESVKVMRFFFEGTALWSNVITWYDPSIPVVGALTLDGSGGDAIRVTGRVESFSGEKCVVKAYWGTSEEALTEWADVSQELEEPGAFELELVGEALKPGTLYYVRVEAVPTDGTAGESAIGSVTTAADTVSFSVVPTVTTEHITATASGTVADLGMHGTVKVSLWAKLKDSADDYVQVGETELTKAGAFLFSGKLGGYGTYVYEVRVTSVSQGGTVETAATAASGNVTPKDTTTYTWKGGEEGVWDDAANWDDGLGNQGDSYGYPQSSDATATFTQGTTATITLNASYVVKITASAANLNLTFKRGEGLSAAPTLTSGFTTGGKNSTITLDGVKVVKGNSNVDMSEGGKLILQNGATMSGVRDLNCRSTGAGIYLKAESTLSAAYANFGPCEIEIDNSTLTFSGGVMLYGATSGTNLESTFRFKGAQPLFKISAANPWFTVDSRYPNFAGTFEFFVPEGGYTEAPFQCPQNGNRTNVFGGNPAYGSAVVRVAESSPVFAKIPAKKDREMVLMSWDVTGLNKNFLSVEMSRKGEFVWGEEATEGKALTLSYKVNADGMCIRIR